MDYLTIAIRVARRLAFEISGEDEHFGRWYHGGNFDLEHDQQRLYVSDELDEARHYAEMKGGELYILKPEYEHLVSWAMGHSEGIIEQADLREHGGPHTVFEPM